MIKIKLILLWANAASLGLTRSDVGVGGNDEGASVEDWLQVEGAGSEAVGEAACADEELFPFGISGSALSSSFIGEATLKSTKIKDKSSSMYVPFLFTDVFLLVWSQLYLETGGSTVCGVTGAGLATWVTGSGLLTVSSATFACWVSLTSWLTDWNDQEFNKMM